MGSEPSEFVFCQAFLTPLCLEFKKECVTPRKEACYALLLFRGAGVSLLLQCKKSCKIVQ